MRVVVALGGNAMTAADGAATPAAQLDAIGVAMAHVADLIAHGHDVLLTHGNGPQVGNLLVKNEIAAHVVPPVPLDWCVAQTQATIGFTMMNALEAHLHERAIDRLVAALVTRVQVDPSDPGFINPTKPIGRYLPYDQAKVLLDHGQQWEDRGAKGWRRVVASPEPLDVLELPTICSLLDAGSVVIAAAGGGIPVVTAEDGTSRGVEAVIDKDLTAALLAEAVGAEVLVIATDVESAMLDYGTDRARPIGRVTPQEMRVFAAAGQFASGSMGPKVVAALRFADSGGRTIITSLAHLAEVTTGAFGTVIESDSQRAPIRGRGRGIRPTLPCPATKPNER